jgi:GxxExxY protein
MQSNQKYKYGDITEKIIGCAMKVHAAMGSGFMEKVYQRCLAIEFGLNNIAYIEELDLPIFYNTLEKPYKVGSRRVDFYVEDKIMVELKAKTVLDDDHLAQALNYLEASNHEIGLLINFGGRSLEVKRLLNRKYKAAKESLPGDNVPV